MNNIRELIPPGYKDRAISAHKATSYNLNIPMLYTHKNPAWHPLTINEADVLDPEVIMPRLSQDRLFAPDTEDVMLLEREVNIYRLQMRDDELDHLQEQRRELLRHLNEMQQEDFDDQLHELDARIRARNQELNETERRMREMEAENERLERELNMRSVVTTVQAPTPAPPRPVPQAITRVVEDRPRSKSPGRNILPSVISGLPVQSETRRGFNYEGEQNYQNPNVRGELILNKPLNVSSGIDDNIYGARNSAIQAMRDSYKNNPQGGYVIGATQPLPIQQRVITSAPQPVIMQGGVRPSAMGGQMIYQHHVHIDETTTMVRTAQPIPTASAQGRTYRINGMTYTDATLPPQYAHLRG